MKPIPHQTHPAPLTKGPFSSLLTPCTCLPPGPSSAAISTRVPPLVPPHFGSKPNNISQVTILVKLKSHNKDFRNILSEKLQTLPVNEVPFHRTHFQPRSKCNQLPAQRCPRPSLGTGHTTRTDTQVSFFTHQQRHVLLTLRDLL